MVVAALAGLGAALASPIAVANQQGPSIRTVPIQEVLRQSAVVVEGPVIEARVETWLGPSGASRMLVWRVSVEQALQGRVASGVLDVVVDAELPPRVDPGDRVLVLANVRTLYLPTYIEGRQDLFGKFPAYDDLVVPTVDGALYHTYSDGGSLAWSSPGIQDGADWLPETRAETFGLSWADLVGRVRKQAEQCSGCGATISGSTVPHAEAMPMGTATTDIESLFGVPVVSSAYSRVTADELASLARRVAPPGGAEEAQRDTARRNLRQLQLAVAGYRSALVFQRSTLAATLYEKELVLLAMQSGGPPEFDRLEEEACALRDVPRDCVDGQFPTCGAYDRLASVAAALCRAPTDELPEHSVDHDFGLARR